jgi:hypothetical protein
MGKVVAKPEEVEMLRYKQQGMAMPYIHCPYPSASPLRLLMPATSSTVQAVSSFKMMLSSPVVPTSRTKSLA